MGEFDTKRNGIPVKILETGEEFNSIKACADAIGGNASCVSRVVKRLMIRYKEDGGIDRDGTVELRRNVPDLSLGESKYSQVRIMVDGKKYIKGMAVYKDDKDFPPGVDVIFNTNKSKSVPKLEVLKDVKPDPDNPFGSLIKDADQGGQYWYTDKNGKKKLGLINKRSDEGDWTDWQNALPSQFLSKQSKVMAEKQLGIAKADKQAEYEAIMALTNPTVKKYYLDKFASSCDSAAVHLKAAALPGQKYHVILPVTSLSEEEVYAPGYPEGSKLALIRYPHGGTFEIPICTVNHKNKDAIKMIGKLKPKDVKKASQQALTKAREEVGSVSRRERNIVITDKEWDAIQAGAVSESILKRILNNCDPDSLRQRAMPKETKVLNQAKINRIKAMSASYTIQQIAEKFGVSTSTVYKYLKGAN